MRKSVHIKMTSKDPDRGGAKGQFACLVVDSLLVLSVVDGGSNIELESF